ncbi:MAG: VCBS repeat-containing protein [Pirellulaceae bacterium]|nr:VCBS repeat-containing protein [Pirellulaceae bacterium]
MRYYLTLFIVWLVSPMLVLSADRFPTFQEQTIDAEIGKVCYAVTLVDVDGDGEKDIVAVSENRVLWYQNPTWKSRVIIRDATPRDNVCIAPADIDGDGQVDFALGAGWTAMGTIHWIERGESLDETWQVHPIGEERWLHRMRWADVLGTGRAQLVISPLNATVGQGVRLTAFEIPTNPAKDRWLPTVLNANLNRMHNHWHTDFDQNEVVDTLTASQEGVHLIRRATDGWNTIKLGTGAVADDPSQSGAGEIKAGRLADGTRFIATVEPMHGHSLVVYTAGSPKDALWNRHVVDDGFRRGHALWTADMDGDGGDEIVFGHSDTPEAPGVNVYQATGAGGTQWKKHVIDAGGMATEDLMVADLTGDGRPDIVAGGRATHNVKLYINLP